MPPPNPLPSYLYKILPNAPPSPLPSTLPLSPLDASDGFIHLSTSLQVPGTAARFFSDSPKLWILEIPIDDIGGELRWEEAPGTGDVFPHLYGGDLGSENVVRVIEVSKAGEGEDGWLGEGVWVDLKG